MNKSALLDELMQLDYDDRLEIAERLWDTVHPPGSAAPGCDVGLTDDQMAEIERRLEEQQKAPGACPTMGGRAQTLMGAF